MERDQFTKALVDAFRREAMMLSPHPMPILRGDALEFLARHHGVPMPILDWSSSPYVAAYFAYSGVAAVRGRSVAIWSLDREDLGSEFSGVELIDDPTSIWENPRAIRQRGVFARITTVDAPLETALGEAHTKITLPATDRDLGLSDLDAMMINGASLLGDLDSVARTITSRFSRWDGGDDAF